MGWLYSNGGGSSYAWSGLNTCNQHAAAVGSIPAGAAITKIFVKAAGYNTGTVDTRLMLWSPGSSVLGQSATFSMADGSESTQYSYEKSLSTPYVFSAGGTLWAGLYRKPNESHIMETSTSASGYRKSNTSTFPNAYSMSSYNTHSSNEPYVGVFYIVAPSAPNSQTVTRNSDTSHTVQWNRTASSDDPYYTTYVERWDNVSNTWYVKYTLTTDYTSTGTNSYTDTTTVANRYYRYRIRAWNNAGYSSYAYTSYINTTPAAPSSVVATRSGSNVNITWSDNATNEDQFRIQRRESTDEGDTWGSWADMSPATVSAGVTLATDTSPYTYGQYRVRAEETADSLNSSYVESNEVVTLSTPDVPTGLSPDGGVFDADEAKTFLWQHNPTDQTEQTKYSLTYKISGGSYPGTDPYDETVSTDEFVEIPAATFTNGNDYVWKCKTWGEYSTGSDYSSESTFKCVSRPDGTITQPTAVSNYNYSELTVQWTYTQSESEDQKRYLCKLYNDSDVLLETKELNLIVATGNTGQCVFDEVLLNNTTYKVTLQVQEYNGLWSAETEVEFLTEFLQPMQPSISLSLNEENGSVDINVVNPDVIYEFTENSTKDTYVDIDNSGTNYNNNGQLQLENNTGTGTTIKTILLDFDLSGFVGKSIVDAQLNLYRKTTLTPGIDSKVNYIKSSFDEATVNYSSLPTLDTTNYDNHTHSAGESESWDITNLVSDVADETITDFEGVAVVATTTDGSTDEFYDSTIADNEPELLIEITPENAETDHNLIYRSVNGGNWELVTNEEIPANTTITDYIPNIGGNNNYKAIAISSTPSSNESEEVDIDILMTGLFFINGGNGFEDYVKLVGDISTSENINRDETDKQFYGREYGVKYQGYNKIHSLSFSADLPIVNHETLIDIIENIGNIFYRDWRGRWFYCSLSNCKFDLKDNEAYQFNCLINRLANLNGVL